MKRSGAMVQVSAVVLLVALIGLGAGGLYSYTSSGGAGSGNQAGSGSFNTATSKYLGYIPKGYTVAPLLPSSPSYSCPSNFNSTLCAQFKASCGNGVCDPNETCSTCPIDCGVPQGLSCDPYTGRASGLGGICELSIPYSNTQPGGPLNPCQNPGGCPAGG
jgi:hypothetical protein